MVDFGSEKNNELDLKLKKLKEESESHKEELEMILQRKKQELDDLELQVKEKAEEAKEKEKKVTEEIFSIDEEEALEERINDVKRIIEESESEISDLYSNNQNLERGLQNIDSNLDYLNNAPYISEDRRKETQRDLYNQVREVRNTLRERNVDESYFLNEMRRKTEEANKRQGEDSFGYMKKIRNMLGDFQDYIKGDRK